jgi:hypothetical protein
MMLLKTCSGRFRTDASVEMTADEAFDGRR